MSESVVTEEQLQHQPQPEQPQAPKLAIPGQPNSSWNDIITTLIHAEDLELMQVMSSLLNTKLDAMSKFEGRTRFQNYDIEEVYIAMRYFVDFKKLHQLRTQRKQAAA